MTDANNANDPAQVVTISPNNIAAPKGQPGQVFNTNGNWITIPVNTSGGTCASQPGQTYTITIGGGGGGGQLSFDDIDLAVPVDKKKKGSDGCFCKKCKEFYQYAEPNQDDDTLICYGCRMRW